jgi:hypothetical protein
VQRLSDILAAFAWLGRVGAVSLRAALGLGSWHSVSGAMVQPESTTATRTTATDALRHP